MDPARRQIRPFASPESLRITPFSIWLNSERHQDTFCPTPGGILVGIARLDAGDQPAKLILPEWLMPRKSSNSANS
jgi:hypothetical protein